MKNTNTNAKYDTCLNIVKNMDWKNLEIILPTQTLKIDYKIWGLLLFFILFDVLLFNNRIDNWSAKKPIYVRWSVYTLLIFGLMAMGGVDNVPFIYFQF